MIFPLAETETYVEKFLFGMKKVCSFKIKQEMIRTKSPWLSKLVRTESGEKVFHFWHQGPGYDQNLFTEKAISKAIDYLHANPVRAGLCKSVEDWKWSSWKFYCDPVNYEQDVLPKIWGVPH
jgi:hypothetical protein